MGVIPPYLPLKKFSPSSFFLTKYLLCGLSSLICPKSLIPPLTVNGTKALASLESCHVTSSRQGVNENLRFLKVFKAYLREFSIFFYEIFIVARSQ